MMGSVPGRIRTLVTPLATNQSSGVGTTHGSQRMPPGAKSGEAQAHDHAHDHDHEHEHGHGRAHAHHGHTGSHHHGRGATARALTGALLITALYAAVEAGMGLWTGSLALLADAGHMITDSGALALSLFVARIAQRPRSLNMTYGYRRAEVIGALVNAASMLAISLFILVEAIVRMREPPELHGTGVIYTAVGGLVLNLLSALLLTRGAEHDLNVRSALLHVLGDALGSVAAIIAGLCIWLFGFALADPLASLAIAGVLGVGSLRLLREAADVLMEATPTHVDIRQLERTIVETPGVAAIHDLHVWCLTPSQPMLTAHVVLTPAAHGTDVAKRVGERLHTLHGLDHVTIQPEPPAPDLVPLRLRSERKKG
jgi:cobalt-zinc-cadmium efflux system protein